MTPVQLPEVPARYVVLKASGSRYAYVNDTELGRTVKRYDILKGEGVRNGWNMAQRHCDNLNREAATPSETNSER